MVANFDRWIDERVMSLADDPSMYDWPEPEPPPVDYELLERVRRELDEDVAAATRKAVEEAFA